MRARYGARDGCGAGCAAGCAAAAQAAGAPPGEAAQGAGNRGRWRAVGGAAAEWRGRIGW